MEGLYPYEMRGDGKPNRNIQCPSWDGEGATLMRKEPTEGLNSQSTERDTQCNLDKQRGLGGTSGACFTVPTIETCVSWCLKVKPELDLSRDSRVVLRSRDGRGRRESARTRLVIVRVLHAIYDGDAKDIQNNLDVLLWLHVMGCWNGKQTLYRKVGVESVVLSWFESSNSNQYQNYQSCFVVKWLLWLDKQQEARSVKKDWAGMSQRDCYPDICM